MPAKKVSKYTIVSNVDEWTVFFRELIDQIKSGKLRFPKNDKVDMQLINTASTKSKTGSPFFYFQAVDTGRKSITAKGGKRLFFTVGKNSPFTVSKEVVGPAAGFLITAKSVAQIQATFSAEVVAKFRQWLNEAKLPLGSPRDEKGRFTVNPLKNLGNFKTTPKRKNGKSVPLLADVEPSRARLTIAQRQEVNSLRSSIFNETKKTLSNKGMQKDQAIRTAKTKARVESTKREIKFRQAYAKAGLKAGAGVFKFLKKGPQDLDPAKSRFFDILQRVPDKDALLAIFMDIIENQIEIFKSNTPTLSQFKLLSDGTVLSPESGGTLRDSYQIKSAKDLKNI